MDSRHLVLAAVLAIILVQLAYADSLMVTVAQTSGKISIKHVEMLSAMPSAQMGEGDYILAYETEAEVVITTAFYIPSFTQGQTLTPLSYSEQTIFVPVLAEAKNVSVYNATGDRLATFPLDGISKVGDAKGTPPQGSIAAQTGQISETKAVNDIIGKVPTGTTGNTGNTGTTGTTDTSNGDEKGGFCLAGLVVPALGAGALYSRKRKNQKK